MSVAHLETIRLLVSLADVNGWNIHHLDVKMTILYGELKEEVYFSQRECFVKQGEERKVYKLAKALYGLQKSPRACNLKYNNTLKDTGFRRCLQENAVYRIVANGECFIVTIYVDDLFVTGSSLEFINQIKKIMVLHIEI